MFRHLNWPRFGIRTLLVLVAFAAVMICIFVALHSRGAALMQTSAKLQEYRIFALEKSQIGDSHFVDYTPFDDPKTRKAEIPVFNRKNPSFVRKLLGDEVFVNYDTIVVDLYIPVEELETKITELGEICKIYCTINTGLTESDIQRLQRRFPRSEIVKLDLIPDLRALESD